MPVLLCVCKAHHFLTTRHYAYAKQVDNKVRATCIIVFCKQCIVDCQPFMTDYLSTEMEHLMCNTHLYESLEQQQEDAVSVTLHKQSPLAKQLSFSPGNYVAALKNQFVNSTNVASTEPLTICSVALVPPLKAHHQS